MSFMVVAALFVLGAAFGSFSLALAYRLKHHKDWVKGRSECEKCHHQLAAKDLVPGLSWLTLGGRCRYCRKPLSKNLILSEVGLGLAFAASYFYWPSNLSTGLSVVNFVIWLAILVLFSTLFWYDLQWMILPNRVVYPLIVLSAAFFITSLWPDFSSSDFIALAASIAVSSGLFLAIYLVSRGKWIGFGDVRLGVALGLIIADPFLAVLNIFLASLLGTLIVIAAYLSGRKQLKKLPFGPLLIVAAVIVVLFGQNVVDWYLGGVQF